MAHGSFRPVLGPIVLAAFATGWTALVVYLLGIPINALSAALPALAVAVTGGLGFLVSDRYRRGRDDGLGPDAVLARGYRAMRTPLLASTAAAIVGFAALAPSDMRMLRDFGVDGAIAFAVVLAASTLVLPAALVWAELAAPVALPRTRAEAAGLVRSFAAKTRSGAAALGQRLRRLPVAARRARREP
jgi:uncharacterized protein